MLVDPVRFLEAIDRLLVMISEFVQRADDAARSLHADGANAHLCQRLEEAAREANAVYVQLFRDVYLSSRGTPPPRSPGAQLELALDPAEPARSRHEAVTVPSAGAPTLDEMNEAHMLEIERVLFTMSECRRRAERVARDLAKDGAEPHLVEAVERAERELEATIDTFFKGTYFAVPKEQLTLR